MLVLDSSHWCHREVISPFIDFCFCFSLSGVGLSPPTGNILYLAEFNHASAAAVRSPS